MNVYKYAKLTVNKISLTSSHFCLYRINKGLFELNSKKKSQGQIGFTIQIFNLTYK